jgi:hypothetical protein
MSHFEDALESGESPSDVIAAYGDEKTAAKLLRSACKRKRWWVEIALVKSMKYTAAALGCFILLYFVLVLFALQREPNIAVDYVAKMNETADAVPEGERAWPLYRAASIALNADSEPSPEVDDRYVHPTWVGDAGWKEYATWLDVHKETLDLIRQGTEKQGMGFIVGGAVDEEDKELWPEAYEEKQETIGNPMIGILFPQLGHMRSMARLLQYDAILAASVGDGGRCVQDINAMIRLGTHTREHSTLINDLVSISIYNLAFQTVAIILEHDPEGVPLDQFQHMLVTSNAEFEIRFDGERMFFLDILQRVFTDDGYGDGVVIPQNLLHMMSEMSMPLIKLSILLAPLGDLLIASRKEIIDHYDEYITHVEKYRQVPLFEWDDEIMEFELALARSKGEVFLNKYFLLDMLMPVFDRAMLAGKYAAARRDGLLAVMYAMNEHRTTGKWPVGFVEAGVVDPYTGDPWRIAIIDEQPVIYSLGIDGDDDGGKHVKGAHEWLPSDANIPDGDWVVWPNPE